MLTSEALRRFEEFVVARGNRVADLDARDAVDAMLAFYLVVRGEDVDLESDGDMLLFQWGTYDWGEGTSFQYEVTRQFIVDSAEGSDDEAFWHLSLTLHLVPTPDTEALALRRPVVLLASGCRSIPALHMTRLLRRCTPVTIPPIRVELVFGPAG